MRIFHNSKGGHCKFNSSGNPVGYIFPANAFVEISGVKISIGSLHVKTHPGKFDSNTGEFFQKLAARIPTGVQTYNTDIFINDSDLSGSGYPSHQDFKKYNVPFISRAEFEALQEKIKSKCYTQHEYRKSIELTEFFNRSTADNRRAIAKKILTILDDQKPFPKNISLAYDDRLLQNTIHVVLCFSAKDSCEVRIDNTISVLGVIKDKELFEKTHQIDCKTCIERILDENNVMLYRDKNDEKPIRLETDFLLHQYRRMLTILTKINIPIKSIYLNNTYIQKATDACVPFSLQNKIDFLTKTPHESDERAEELDARLRAEHTILSCLIMGATKIPRMDDQTCRELGFGYSDDEWYPNYSLACDELHKAIMELSLSDIKTLFLSIEIDGELSLDFSYRKLLLEIMGEKSDLTEYEALDSVEIRINKNI